MYLTMKTIYRRVCSTWKMEVWVNLAKFNIIQMQNLSFDFVTNVTLNYDTGYCRQFPRTHTCTYTHYNYLTALTQLSLLKQFIDNETTLNYYRCLSLCFIYKLSKYWNKGICKLTKIAKPNILNFLCVNYFKFIIQFNMCRQYKSFTIAMLKWK